MLFQILSGSALGLFLGTLIGFSQSPVVATVVGALTGALLLLLGFEVKPAPDGPGDGRAAAAAARLLGFGFCATLAMVLALYARTHNSLSAPIQTQVADLMTAGFSPDEAHAWVAYKNAGLLLRLKPEDLAPKDATGKLTSSTALFASEGIDTCLLLDKQRLPRTSDRLQAIRAAGDRATPLADSLGHLDEASQDSVMQGLNVLLCAGATR